ncbi:hypothetical protein ACJX0J_017832, partial [Zea mays]
SGSGEIKRMVYKITLGQETDRLTKWENQSKTTETVATFTGRNKVPQVIELTALLHYDVSLLYFSKYHAFFISSKS